VTARRAGVVFVNFHSEELILPRARRLLEAGFRVAVTDNSGTFPTDVGIETIAPGANLGFAAGCNYAARHLGSEVDTLCFHNPDVEIAADDIRLLVDRLNLQASPGLISPAESVGDRVRLNGYHYPGPVRELAVIGKWFRRFRHGNRQQHDARHPQAPALLTGRGRRFASAALLVADAAAFDKVGGFDGRYFMYAEDLDLWHRMGQLGRGREFVTDVRARHAYGEGSPLSAVRRELYRWLGVELFVALNGTGWWSAYRSVHRAYLPAIARLSPEATRSISSLWSRGARPEEVAEQLFPEMARAGASAV
jgi:N-acetylglucosaminyl-diphospho-decaprenol L-rhamnosyltransferase